jgi:hypothetical protein
MASTQFFPTPSFPSPQVRLMRSLLICLISTFSVLACQSAMAADPPLKLHWEKNYLTISGTQLPGGEMEVNYLEAYCRAGSTDADWGKHTVVGHTTELINASDDGTQIKLRCTLKDGVIVDHTITSKADEVDFRLKAHNPTDKRSEAHWAQPCIRVDKFCGGDQESYLGRSFVFLDGELSRMPTRDWATKARYIPGQVWCPKGESKLFATAFEPYQELFQGVRVCLHSDFRLGGLKPGEKKDIHGKIYIVSNDVDALLKRYAKDFPEHVASE